MDAKVSFGVDFLNIMGNADLKSGQSDNRNGFDLARLFLITEWGLSLEEGDESNKLFWEQVNKKTLEGLDIVAERFISHLKKDPAACTKFLTQMITINFLDGKITDEERDFTMAFANDLDFRKSEVNVMVEKAVAYATAYGFFGRNFEKSLA